MQSRVNSKIRALELDFEIAHINRYKRSQPVDINIWAAGGRKTFFFKTEASSAGH